MNAMIAVAGFLFLGIFLMFDFLDVDIRTNFQPRNLPTMQNATPPCRTHESAEDCRRPAAAGSCTGDARRTQVADCWR